MKGVYGYTPALRHACAVVLTEMRHVAGFTRAELAERAHIDPELIAAVEEGQRPLGLGALMQLGPALGTTAEDLAVQILGEARYCHETQHASPLCETEGA